MQSYNIWVGDTRKDCINHCVKWSHYFIRTFPYLRPFIQSCRLILVFYSHIHHIRITFFTSCYLIFKIQKTTPSPYFHRDTLCTASLWTSTTAFYNRLTGHYSWLAKEKEKKKSHQTAFFSSFHIWLVVCPPCGANFYWHHYSVFYQKTTVDRFFKSDPEYCKNWHN